MLNFFQPSQANETLHSASPKRAQTFLIRCRVGKEKKEENARLPYKKPRKFMEFFFRD